MRAFVLLVVPMILVVAPPSIEAALGAYVGTGPSSLCSSTGHCTFRDCDAQLALRPSDLGGLWAADLLAVVVYDVPPCSSSLTGSVHWPSHVLEDLEGSPESGFTASGWAQYVGTSSQVVAYRLTIAPLGEATEWSLLVSWDGTFEDAATWKGVARFHGAHL